jgi:hypothetical protein
MRAGRMGLIEKVSAVFPDGDLDLVIIPVTQLILLKCVWTAGLVHVLPRARQALRDLSQVLRAGYYFVKSNDCWEKLFCKIAASTSLGLLDDEAVCKMADGYVCDYISAKQKLYRGEYIAAQRWLHVNLAEVNFRLLYERGLRIGKTSYADGRRIESVEMKDWRDAASVNVSLDFESLNVALEKSALTLRKLMRSLVGAKWQWPDLSLRLR